MALGLSYPTVTTLHPQLFWTDTSGSTQNCKFKNDNNQSPDSSIYLQSSLTLFRISNFFPRNPIFCSTFSLSVRTIGALGSLSLHFLGFQTKSKALAHSSKISAPSLRTLKVLMEQSENGDFPPKPLISLRTPEETVTEISSFPPKIRMKQLDFRMSPASPNSVVPHLLPRTPLSTRWIFLYLLQQKFPLFSCWTSCLAAEKTKLEWKKRIFKYSP